MDKTNALMSVHLFGEQLFETNADQLAKTVRKTGETASKFYESHYRKMHRNAST